IPTKLAAGREREQTAKNRNVRENPYPSRVSERARTPWNILGRFRTLCFLTSDVIELQRPIAHLPSTGDDHEPPAPAAPFPIRLALAVDACDLASGTQSQHAGTARARDRCRRVRPGRGLRKQRWQVALPDPPCASVPGLVPSRRLNRSTQREENHDD